jgi:hypothetical protein
MTFEVVIVACLAIPPGSCIGVGDQWGPYDTHEACEERRAQLVAAVTVAAPFGGLPYQIGSVCRPTTPEGELM